MGGDKLAYRISGGCASVVEAVSGQDTLEAVIGQSPSVDQDAQEREIATTSEDGYLKGNGAKALSTK